MIASRQTMSRIGLRGYDCAVAVLGALDPKMSATPIAARAFGMFTLPLNSD